MSFRRFRHSYPNIGVPNPDFTSHTAAHFESGHPAAQTEDNHVESPSIPLSPVGKRFKADMLEGSRDPLTLTALLKVQGGEFVPANSYAMSEKRCASPSCASQTAPCS